MYFIYIYKISQYLYILMHHVHLRLVVIKADLNPFATPYWSFDAILEGTSAIFHCYWFRFRTSHFTGTKHPLFHLGLNSGWFRAVPVFPVDFGEFRRYTNSSRYWNQTRSTHIVTAPITWRNASHHSSLLFLLLQFFCAFHPLQLSFLF